MKIADRLKCLATLWFLYWPFGSSQKVQFCQVLDSRKWIVPDGMAITLEAMDAVLEKNIESLSKVFDHFTQTFKKISPAITQLRGLLMSISALLCMQWRIIITSSTHHWRCGNCWICLKTNVDGTISSQLLSSVFVLHGQMPLSKDFSVRWGL